MNCSGWEICLWLISRFALVCRADNLTLHSAVPSAPDFPQLNCVCLVGTLGLASALASTWAALHPHPSSSACWGMRVLVH